MTASVRRSERLRSDLSVRGRGVLSVFAIEDGTLAPLFLLFALKMPLKDDKTIDLCAQV